jgi:hypothetical protein
MTYSYIQQDLVQCVLHCTDVSYDLPLDWASYETESKANSQPKKKSNFIDEDAFTFTSLSKNQVFRKKMFYEVEADENKSQLSLMDKIWKDIMIY